LIANNRIYLLCTQSSFTIVVSL